MLTIEEYSTIPDAVRNFNEFCESHTDERLGYLCLEDNHCICFDCIKDQHQTCKNIIKITDEKISEDLPSKLASLNAELTSAEELIGKIIHSYATNVKELQSASQSAQNELKNLISKILVLDPSRRPTLDEILQDPFMTTDPIPKTIPRSTLACPPAKNFTDQYLKSSVKGSQIK